MMGNSSSSCEKSLYKGKLIYKMKFFIWLLAFLGLWYLFPYFMFYVSVIFFVLFIIIFLSKFELYWFIFAILLIPILWKVFPYLLVPFCIFILIISIWIIISKILDYFKYKKYTSMLESPYSYWLTSKWMDELEKITNEIKKWIIPSLVVTFFVIILVIWFYLLINWWKIDYKWLDYNSKIIEIYSKNFR